MREKINPAGAGSQSHAELLRDLDKMAADLVDWSVILATSGAALGIFYCLTRFGRFTVTYTSDQISCKCFGDRWSSLRVGSMPVKAMRSLQERSGDRILEVHGASGEVLEIPMCIDNYQGLHRLLSNRVRIYGKGVP